MSTLSPTRRNLRSQDVLDLTGATYRQLDYWCTHHGICAEKSASPGQGTSRLFTLTEARAVRGLVLAGQHGLAIGTYARGIVSCLNAQPEAKWLVLSEGRVSGHLMLDAAMRYVSAETIQVPATLIPLRFAK